MNEKLDFGTTWEIREELAISYLKEILNIKNEVENLEEICKIIKKRVDGFNEKINNVCIGLERLKINIKGNNS